MPITNYACNNCKRWMTPKKNSVFVEETFSKEPDGTYRPYKIWQADLWECKTCGNELLTGFASQPLTEHFHPDFKDIQARLISTGWYIIVKGCPHDPAE